MRWQRPLRWGIAAAGLGFAALLYVRFERKPAAPPAAPPPKMAEGASYQSSMLPGAKQVRLKDNKEISAVSYSKLVQFADGRRVIENPRFEGDRDGKPFFVTAGKGELKAPGAGTDPNEIPEETHLIGNVVMHEQDGMEIRTDEAIYRESIASLDIPGAMTFSDGRLSGNATGALYDRNAQLLTLKDQAFVNMAPDGAGEGRFSAHANAMQLNRETHFVSLDGAASVTRDREVLSADSAQLHLSEDNHGVQMMELRQHASIVPVAGAGKTPEMHGDDINVEFLPDGRTMKHAQLLRAASMFLAADTGRKQITGDLLDVQLAPDGQTVTKLFGNGGPVVVTLPASADLPKRVITARQLDATGDEKHGLTAAVFTSRAVFLETHPAKRGQAAVERRVTANQLTLALNGGDFSDIKDAHFDDAVTLRNGDTTGAADDAVYQAKAGKLALRPAGAAGKKSWVATDRIRVDARNIDIDLDKTVIGASGGLTTQTSPDPKAKTSRGLFDDSKPVLGTANELQYDEDKSEAVYLGAARLSQGDTSSIKAGNIRLNDKTGDISADGAVETRFPVDNLTDAKAAAPKANAAKFEYVDATHRALYTGTAKARAQFNSPDGIIRGVTIEMWLSDDGRELKRMVVVSPPGSSGVEARVSADRTARGDRMDRDVSADTYVLTGSPARIIQRTLEDGVETCNATVGPSITFTMPGKGKGEETFEVKPGREGTTSLNLKTCADWIIK